MRVVCIKDSNPENPKDKVFNLIKGEIYTVIGNVNIEGKDYYILKEMPFDCAYIVDLFRPVCDDGDVIAEYIEEVHFKQYEYEFATSKI